MRRRLAAIAVLLTFAAVSCGGDEPQSAAERGCPERIPFVATYLPGGFAKDLKKGPGGGKPAPERVISLHYEASQAKYIDFFRQGRRTKFTGGSPVNIAGYNGAAKKIGGGFAAKVRTGRAQCSRFQIEAFGISQDEFEKFLKGLERGSTAPKS